jgi:hypothetical protein
MHVRRFKLLSFEKLIDMIENSEATKPEVQNEFLKRQAKAQTKEEREMLIAVQNSLQSSGTEEEMVSIAVFSRLAVRVLSDRFLIVEPCVLFVLLSPPYHISPSMPCLTFPMPMYTPAKLK